MALSTTELQDKNRSNNPAQIYSNAAMGGLLYKACATNQMLDIPKFSTMNEYWNVFPELSIGRKAGRDFELKYFSIGSRGSNCLGMNPNGTSRMRVNPHTPKDPRNYVPLPFIARLLSEDLDEDTRKKYRMRTVVEYMGELWAVYWLKLINFDLYNPKVIMVEHDQTTGNEIPEDYIYQEDDLKNLEPPAYNQDGTLPVSNDYMNGSAILDASLNKADLAEIVNAVKVVMGDASLASINEVCVAWGIDSTQTSNLGGREIRYTEALGVTAAHFCSELDARNAGTNSVITLRFDHGNSDPMLLSETTTRG